MARPRKLNRPVLVTAICAAVADGALVKDACADHGITAKTLREWAAEDATFGALYARAREDQAHALAEKALAIADGDDALTLLREEAIDDAEAELKAADDSQWYKKVQALRAGVIARDRLRVDAHKWMASKIAPRAYGERQEKDPPPLDSNPDVRRFLAAVHLAITEVCSPDVSERIRARVEQLLASPAPQIAA